MENIDEIWIIENNGTCLFNQSLGQIDETLFSGFLSSIQTFIETISNERLRKIELGNAKLIIFNLDEYRLFIVLKSSKNVKDKYLEKKIKEIQTKFIVKYGSYLVERQAKSLPCNTRVFEDFREELDDLFGVKIDKNITDWMKSI